MNCFEKGSIMNKLIGLVGSSGLIGAETVKYLLDSGYSVRGGQRREDSQFEGRDEFERFRLDLYDSSQLDRFCKGCDAVVNCAGPAYKIKDLIATSASAAGAIYVDMSDILIIEPAIRNSLAPNGIYIAGTGYVPGISGIMLNTVLNVFDSLSRVQCFQAGRQYYTKTAFYDILLSSMSEAGYPDSCLINNKPERVGGVTDEKIYIPGLAENVYIKPYIPKEMMDLSQRSGRIGQIYWYNALTDKRMMDMIMQSYREIAFSDSYEKAMALYDGIFGNMEKQENWSALLYEAEGTVNGKYARKRFILNIDDSNVVCGITAAQTVAAALENPPSAGIHWAKDIMNYDSIEDFEASLRGCSLTVLDIPVDAPDILEQEDETDFI